jgi:transposase
MATNRAKQYPPELKDRAVRLVFDCREQEGSVRGAVAKVARQLGVGDEALRKWVKQAEIDEGRRPGTPAAAQAKIAALEAEVKDLRRANEILKSATAFFARELDPHHKS